MSDWSMMRINDFAEIVAGGTPSTSVDEYWNGNIGWITPADLSNYKCRYISNGERNITELGLKKSSAYLLPKNTVLLSSRAPIGYVAIAENELATNQGFKNLICDENKVHYRFIYYWLSLNTDVLKSFASGATFPEISASKLKKIKAIIPELPTQKRIADILSAYDELIENNNRRITLLEKAAQELYKEWFVRFRFPDHETVKFENGIPENWRISTVKETFDILDTKRIPLSSMDRDKMRKVYPYYGAAELMDYVDDYIFDGIYLLLGEDGSVITPAGKPVLQYVWGKMWVNNHAHVLQGKSPYSTEYLHLMFGHMDITGIVTGAAQPKISQGRLFKKKTILPTNDLILKFDSLIQPMYKSIRQLREANRNLAKQRDLLLPRLMSGKLEV